MSKAISIHTFLAEGDQSVQLSVEVVTISIHTFLAEGDITAVEYINNAVTISIHTFLAEGDSINTEIPEYVIISIHTFLAEGDNNQGGSAVYKFISIHTFLAEGDVAQKHTPIHGVQFQSTPSSRKVTGYATHRVKTPNNFNPHLPRGR